jgi:hypothetical protein
MKMTIEQNQVSEEPDSVELLEEMKPIETSDQGDNGPINKML